MPSPSDFRHVNHLWDDAAANALDPVGRLIYRSNLLGSDGRITNTGGGNTSAKIAGEGPVHQGAGGRSPLGEGFRR